MREARYPPPAFASTIPRSIKILAITQSSMLPRTVRCVLAGNLSCGV
jgi:hypothetical protein